MGYGVYHTAKGKASGGALGNHIDRTEGKEHSFRNADPDRKHLNQEFANKKFAKLTLDEAVNLRIAEGYNGKRKIRTDAVKYITHILSGSHQDMLSIFSDEEKKNAWIKANADFIKQEFGAENVVRFTLHLDEKTPHIHAVTVPLTDDGRLSAKQRIGNRKVLEQRQDRYGEAMKEFGLERGVKKSPATHKTTADYRKELGKTIENFPFKDEIKISKNILGGIKKETLDEIQKRLKTLKNALIEKTTQAGLKNRDLSALTQKVEFLQEQLANSEWKKTELEERLQSFEHDLLHSPLNLEIRKDWLVQELKEKEAKKQAVSKKTKPEQEPSKKKSRGRSR